MADEDAGFNPTPIDMTDVSQLLGFRVETAAVHNQNHEWEASVLLTLDLEDADFRIRNTKVMVRASDLTLMAGHLISAAAKSISDFDSAPPPKCDHE